MPDGAAGEACIRRLNDRGMVADHGNLARMFAEVRAIVGDAKPICLHENGPIPDPATLGPAAHWLWFMTWHTRWLKDPAQNRPEELAAYYASERYVTREELPRGV